MCRFENGMMCRCADMQMCRWKNLKMGILFTAVRGKDSNEELKLAMQFSTLQIITYSN
jgi:hypothetical protein